MLLTNSPAALWTYQLVDDRMLKTLVARIAGLPHCSVDAANDEMPQERPPHGAQGFANDRH